MLVLLVIVILALPHARPWAHKVSLRNSHSLLYVTKEAHFFPLSTPPSRLSTPPQPTSLMTSSFLSSLLSP